MRRLAELLAKHRRRAARVVLILAALVAGLELWPSLPRDTEVEFALGPDHGRVVELRVAYVQQGEELHGVSFRWESGAPRAVRHSIRLPAGEFVLRCELRDRDGQSRAVSRKLITPTDGVVRVPLFEQHSGNAFASNRPPEERRDDLAGWGAPHGFAGRGDGSRDLSPGRAFGPTKERR